MTDARTITVFGATGLLGRAVTAALVDAGHRVRAFVRDPRRARAALPAECALTVGDLRRADDVARAVDGANVVYTSLSNPLAARRPPWDPDREGMRTILDASRAAGVEHVLRLSAMGAGLAPEGFWWVADSKVAADDATVESGMAFTIFRPTWFMESIPLASIGPLVLRLPSPTPLYWIAAEDYAQQVCAAVVRAEARDRIYHVQGPEPLTMKEACERFVKEWRHELMTVPMPGAALALGGMAGGPLAYLRDLLRMTDRYTPEVPARTEAHDLHRPTITVDEYARRLRASGDWVPARRRA